MMQAISILIILATAACAQTPETDISSGIQAFHHGEYTHALALLSKFPQDARAQTFAALSRAATGNCREAEPDLKHQLASNPDPQLARLSGLALVQCYLSREEFDAVYPVLSDLQRRYPKDADVLYETAKVHRKAWDGAIVKLFQNAPASFRVNQLSAEVFETGNQFSEAIAEYKKAIDKNPHALDLHYRLGRALLLASHDASAFDQARKEFEHELTLNPSDAAAQYQVGQILIAQQKPAEAEPRFERAIELNAAFPEALVALARIRLQEKNVDSAIGLLQRAVEAAPKMESAHYTLMLAYRDTGRTEEARREKSILDQLQRPPEGEFTDFLRRMGEKPPKQP
jgi:tetratricopeptide (TPR) repeat protein